MTLPAIKNVLVGTDFSLCSRSALVQAARIARRNGASLHVLHVIDGLIVVELARAMEGRRSALERQLALAARQNTEEFVHECDTAADARVDVRVGSLLHHTLRKAQEVAADLLVLGVFGASGPAVGASVFSTKVVRKSKVPVMLVAEAHAAPYRTVLACVDFSPTSRRALEHAIRIARQDGGSLCVVHVYFGPWHVLHYRAPTPQASPAFKKQYMDRLQGMLDDFVAPYRSELHGLNVTTSLHEHQSYGKGIIDYAGACRADLVVLGTTGKRNLRTLVLGSTAERVLREVPCSLLAVKPTA